MKTITLFGSVYPVRGLVSLFCSTVFFFTLAGGQTSRDMCFLANIVKIFDMISILQLYIVVVKKGTVLLSTSLSWPAVAGCSRAETFYQLSSIPFAQPCIVSETQKSQNKTLVSETQNKKLNMKAKSTSSSVTS